MRTLLVPLLAVPLLMAMAVIVIVSSDSSQALSAELVYCQKADGGLFHAWDERGCKGHKKISQHRYERLLLGSTSVRKLPGDKKSYSKEVYCRNADGDVYRSSFQCATIADRQITKDEFKRLTKKNTPAKKKAKDKKSDPKIVYCINADRDFYRTEIQCATASDIQITKAEYHRLAAKKATAEIATKDSEPEVANQAQSPALEILDAPYVTLKNVNVRERPDVESGRVTTLAKGTEVTALGKVNDSDWYLISRDGEKLGYIFGPLIAEAESVAAAQAMVPATKVVKNPDAVAVIIGNRNYEGRIPAVDYAHNDADAIKKFVTNLLGYDPDNIIDLRDATQAKLQATFGNERSHQGKLWSYLQSQGKSDVTIYYSGHGVPGLNDQKGYLLPTDADPDHPEINGYPLDTLYANLGQLEARSITVLLDACFSGDSPKGMLIRSASPILVTARDIHQASGGVTVLTAASGDQLASWDEAAKQGLFTRYFLEAVYGAADTNADGAVNLEEVKSYLDSTMTRRARRDFLREQEAWVSGAPETVLVRLGAEE